MRLAILAPLTLALVLAACNTADQVADDTGNAVEQTGSAIADAVDEGAESVSNTVNEATTAATTTDRDSWIGRWRGVEGLNLVIAKGDAPGRYKLDMQFSLDGKGSYEGIGTSEGITFTRPDGDQVLRATDGDATGLKYLAGKKDCLTVKQGEGYCRD